MNTDSMTTALLAIVGGVIGLAIVSVLVSKQAQTPTVLGAAGSSLSSVIAAAVSPVTGTGSGASSGSSSGGGMGGFLTGVGQVSNLFSPSNITSLFGS